MGITQLHRPLVAAASAGAARPTTAVALRQVQEMFASLRFGETSKAVEGRRYAAVKSQGAYRLRDSSTIPKNMGAKKTGGMSSRPPSPSLRLHMAASLHSSGAA